jgi:hypothetical protein
MHPGYASNCKKCNHAFFPPFAGLPQAIERLPETHTGEFQITYVCRECDHCDRYTDKDFHRAMVPGSPGTLSLLLFWHGVYECAHENCGLRIEVMTSAYDGETQSDVFQRIFHATPSPVCAKGHPLQTDGIQEVYLQIIPALDIPLR